MTVKKIKLGSVRVMIGLEDLLIERIRKNSLYIYLIRPIRRFFTRILAPSKEPVPNEAADNHKEIEWSDDTILTIRESPKAHRGEELGKTPEQEAILRRIGGVDWYHSIDLGHGIVTPGAFNHRPHLHKYHLPERLDGMRVLDVATFDGFWAFEFERRGAAEVIALDIESWSDLDLPPSQRATLSAETLKQKTGRGFEIAKEILGSRVRREILSVYSLSPERFGKFDVVFCSDLLIHLMNPMKALQNICSVASGFALIVEPFDPEISLSSPYEEIMHYKCGPDLCRWWGFSLKTLEKMISDSAFKKVELIDTFELSLSGIAAREWHAVLKASS